MFKKVEIWVLYLVVFFGILFAIGFGTLVRQELIGNTKAGYISKFALFLAEIPINTKKILTSSSDLQLQDRFQELSSGFTGEKLNFPSFLLISRFDGDNRDGVVELVNLQSFEIIHKWNVDLDAINSNIKNTNGQFAYLKRDNNDRRSMLHHPILLSNGNLLIETDYLLSIDTCSNLEQINSNHIFHHSIEKDNDDNLWIPNRFYPQKLDQKIVGRDLTQNGGFHDDGIVKLSSDLEILYEKSVAEIFIENEMEYLLFAVGDGQVSSSSFTIDPIHLNDIQPVNFDSKYWKKGDVFLSLRHQSMIILYRPSTNKIIWKLTGEFFHQHDVDILDDKRISFFNNNSKDFYIGDIVDGHNEVLIYDFENDNIYKYLEDSLIKSNIKTVTEGLHEILHNGDLFIEETNFGRLIYFDSLGNKKWTYLNRAKDGNIYGIGWSRIIDEPTEIEKIELLLNKKKDCKL